AVGVAQEGEVELVLFGEAGVCGGIVEADAEDLDVLRVVLILEVPEPGTFGRSAGGVGLRIEPEDDFAAAVVGQPPRLSGVILHFEVRRSIARLQHGSPSSKQESNDPGQRHGAYCSGTASKERRDQDRLRATNTPTKANSRPSVTRER